MDDRTKGISADGVQAKKREQLNDPIAQSMSVKVKNSTDFNKLMM